MKKDVLFFEFVDKPKISKGKNKLGRKKACKNIIFP